MAEDLFADIPKESDLFADIPMPKGRPGVRAALRDLQAKYAKGYSPKYDVTDAATNAMTLGLDNLTDAGTRALITAAQRAVKGGKDPAYTPQDMFDATRIYNDARRAQFAGEHPVQNFAGSVLGGFAMPGAEAIGNFVVGKVAPKLVAAGKEVPRLVRAGQVARTSTVGGALTAASEAANAPPGEVEARAKRGGLTGAIAAPIVGKAADVAVKVAPVAGRTLARMAGRGPTPEAMTLINLQRVLKKGGVSADMLAKVREDWLNTGGVTPATIDLVEKAGGSPEVLELLHRSPAKANARQMAKDYADTTLSEAQPAALKEAQALPTGGESRTPSQIRADLEERYGVVDAEGKMRAKMEARRSDTKTTTINRRGEKAVADLDNATDEALLRTDADLEASKAAIEADRVAGQKIPPSSPVKKETGAAAFAEDLNRKYDASESAYKENFKAYEDAAPETAVVVDEEVRPIFGRLRSLFKGFDPEQPGVKAVDRYLNKVKGEIAPGDEADWPEGEVMDVSKPMTFQQLQYMRDMMVTLGKQHMDDRGGALAMRIKKQLDDEMTRLAVENKIDGDPAIVDKLKTAISGYAEHQRNFGSGLAAKLTERKPNGERVVEPFNAANAIFGTNETSTTNLNKVLSELESALGVASPEAKIALRNELYGRVSPEKLAELRTSTGGKALLPDDLTVEAQAALEATQAANAKAATDLAAAEEAARVQKTALKDETTASRDALTARTQEKAALSDMTTAERQARIARETAARREPTEQSQRALEIGEKALTTDAEAFDPAIGAAAPNDLPLTAAGAKQAVVNAIESRTPQAVGGNVVGDLTSPRSVKNLSLATDPVAVERMTARMKQMQRQGHNALDLERASRVSARESDALIGDVGPADLAYPKRGAADIGFKLWKKYGRLNSQKEYEAGLKILTSKDPAAIDSLIAGLVEKYPKARKAAAPFLVRGLANQGDSSALDRLREEYGVQ